MARPMGGPISKTAAPERSFSFFRTSGIRSVAAPACAEPRSPVALGHENIKMACRLFDRRPPYCSRMHSSLLFPQPVSTTGS